jgi:hypothetical protein
MKNSAIEIQEIKGIARAKFLPGKLEKWKRLTMQSDPAAA